MRSLQLVWLWVSLPLQAKGQMMSEGFCTCSSAAFTIMFSCDVCQLVLKLCLQLQKPPPLLSCCVWSGDLGAGCQLDSTSMSTRGKPGGWSQKKSWLLPVCLLFHFDPDSGRGLVSISCFISVCVFLFPLAHTESGQGSLLSSLVPGCAESLSWHLDSNHFTAS